MSDQPLTTPIGGGPSVLGMAQDELEPPYDDPSKQPKTLTKSRHIDNVFYLAGRKGNPDREQYDLMFVTVAADDEEMARAKKNFLGFHINQEAEYLRGATGAIKLPANRAYIDLDDCYYTAVCKWLLPRTKRSKPPMKAMKWGLPILEDEIKRVKPKIICCLGKPAFDLLYDGKISFDDAHGGWFWSKQYNAYLYVMYAPAALIGKPEYYEQFRVDFEEVHRQLKRMQDGGIQEAPVRYEVIRNEQDLRDWIERLREIPDEEWPGLKDEEGHKVFAVDCEWHGKNYLDGKLRTIQFAWTESDAVVIEFRDETTQWSFHIDNEGKEGAFFMRCCKPDLINGGVVYEDITDEDEAMAAKLEIEAMPNTPEWVKEHNNLAMEHARRAAHGPIEDDLPEAYEKKKYAYIGKIISDYCEEEGVVYVGHHFSADAPWMQYWLGLTTDGRCWMDTEFAQQTVDESSVLSLERGIAMKYTTLGLYNLDLALWKREHKQLWEGGYGYVPSEIILPYAAKDVIAPFRAAPQIKHLLEIQDLWTYYRRILNPFVTDVFTAFHMHGLPTDIQLLDELRDLYHFAKEKLDVKFRQRMAGEAKAKLLEKLLDLPPVVSRRKPHTGVFTVGHEASYDEGLIEHGETFEKLGREGDYPGGLAFKTVADAERWIDENGKRGEYAVYAVDASWETDTVPTASGWWSALVHSARILHKVGTDVPIVTEVPLSLFQQMCDAGSPDAALDLVKPFLDTDNVYFWTKLTQHLYDAPAFNIRSPDQMRTWLFDVHGLTPIKSTNQKAKGLPSMAWEKVLELPPERQRIYTPAVDKQTLQILSEEFDTLDELLNLNAVGNVCKAFLKQAETYEDESGQEVTEEQGIMAWVCSDRRIRYNLSCTETSRSRTWCPNILNLPSYVNKRIQSAITRVIRECHEEGDLPEHLMKWVGQDSIPSVRSCFRADPGNLFVESDLKTAEMFALAYVSGDRSLMRILEEPDPEWAVLKPGRPGPYVRVRYASFEENGIPYEKQNPDYIMTVWKDGEFKGKVSEDDLERNPDGSVMHRNFDIHWSVVERTYGRPREEMIEKVHRNAGKVLNFSSAYGASPASLERKIESDTGVKPEPGTGQKGLEAIAARQPRATQFLEEMAEIPARGGSYRAASGRIRHCVVHGDSVDVGWRTRKSIESAIGREFRNFPMQESVAATAARACKWALDLYRNLGLKAKPVVCLYDSLVTMCPFEERFIVAKLHQVLLSDINGWRYIDVHGDRTLRYGIDTEFNERWSTNVKAYQKQMEDPEFHPTPEHLKWILDFENWDLMVS